MTSVRRKIVFVLALILGLYAIGQCVFQMLVVMPSFRALQHDDGTTDGQRCKSLIESEIVAISRTAFDWSAWDDTYKFISDRNKEYAESNLTYDTFKSNKLNVFYIVDCNGAIVWGHAYDLATEAELTIPELSESAMHSSPRLCRPPSLEAQLSGIYRSSRGPILICSSPIITSKHEGPVLGVVIMGRFLDKEHVAELASAFKMDLAVSQIDPAEGARVDLEGFQVEDGGPQTLRVNGAMADVFGRPAIRLALTVPTPITARGRSTALSSMVSSIVTSGLVLWLMYWLLKRIVLARLAKIDGCIANVSGTQDLSLRVDVGGSDELSRVATNLNGMLGRLGQAEEALGHSEERFRTAFLSAPFPIMIHASDGAIVQINERWLQLTGFSRDDIPTLDAWAQKACDGQGCLCDSAKGDVAFKDGLFSVRTRNGNCLTWEFTSATCGLNPEGKRLTMSIAIDVTQREVARRLLSDSESRYRSLSENIPAVICTTKIDRCATVLYISPQVTRYFGYSAREFLRTPDVWKNIIYCEDYQRVMDEYYTCCTQRIPFTSDYRALGRDGNLIWMHQEASVVDTADGPVAQGVIFDIDHVKSLELQVRQANSKLLETDRLKTEFMINVSHELRTPLTIFRNVMSNAIANVYGPLSPALRTNIGICEESVGRLARIVSDFLDMSRIEANKLQLILRRVDMNDICQMVAKSMAPMAAARGTTIEVQPAAQPVLLTADRDRLVQVLTNLLGNAVKFVPENAGRIEVSVTPGEGKVIVAVRDNGKGIQPGDMERLFKRFVQLEQHAGPGSHGTGLGLAISKELIALHGGEIWVESTPGTGSTFSFSLPLEKAPADSLAPQSASN
jgi:PAS domain S-box-containing protein